MPGRHRRTSHGDSAAAAPESGKTIIFGQKLNFSDWSQQPKWKKFVFIN